MTISVSIMLAAVLAVPIGGQETAKPAVEQAIAQGDADQANRAALSQTAAQTARIVEDRDANARNLADYEQAKADYARSLARIEAEHAAAVRKAAADAETYRQQLEAWRASTKGRSTPTRQPPTVAARAKNPPRRNCTFEHPTGSNFPVRVCQSN